MWLFRRKAKDISKTALVIIDMQPGAFEAACKEETIDTCCREIKKAVEEGIPIIVLEYMGEGETGRKLKYYLDSYKFTKYVIKKYDDGSSNIIDCVKDNGWDIDTFRVCGVNTTACVARTIDSLVNVYNKKVRVIKKGCNGETSQRYAFKNKTFRNRNVSLV